MKRIYTLLLTFLNIYCWSSSSLAQDFPLVPYPSHLEAKTGNFTISKTTTLKYNPLFSKEVLYLKDLLNNATGYTLKTTKTNPVFNTIDLQVNKNITAKEGYSIAINNKQRCFAHCALFKTRGWSGNYTRTYPLGSY